MSDGQREFSSEHNILEVMLEKEPKWNHDKNFAEMPLLQKKESNHRRNYTSVYGSKEKDPADKQIKQSILTVEHMS